MSRARYFLWIGQDIKNNDRWGCCKSAGMCKIRILEEVTCAATCHGRIDRVAARFLFSSNTGIRDTLGI